jgi:hypothetical protein
MFIIIDIVITNIIILLFEFPIVDSRIIVHIILVIAC